MFVSKRPWSSWREIQDAYEGYISSLGPWPEEATIDRLQDEYPKPWPDAEGRIGALLSGVVETVAPTFRSLGPRTAPSVSFRARDLAMLASALGRQRHDQPGRLEAARGQFLPIVTGSFRVA